jgi:hypothetical protein
MPFLALLTEIHIAILTLLDQQSLVNCTSTNHYFHEMGTSSTIQQTLFNSEPVFDKEGVCIYPGPLVGQKWPCFTCLRLVRSDRFPAKITFAMVQVGTPAETRDCRACTTPQSMGLSAPAMFQDALQKLTDKYDRGVADTAEVKAALNVLLCQEDQDTQELLR